MKIQNKRIEIAKSVDIVKFMNEYFPGRLVNEGKSFKDREYFDVSIFKGKDGLYHFKCFGKSDEISNDIKGSDMIAYVRRFIPGLEKFDVACFVLSEFVSEYNKDIKDFLKDENSEDAYLNYKKFSVYRKIDMGVYE